MKPRRDVGASLSVYRHGEQVVDLWGGSRDAARTQTLDARHAGQCLFDDKGIVADGDGDGGGARPHRLRGAGHALLARIRRQRQRATTVAHALSHQAGLPGFAAPTGAGRHLRLGRLVARNWRARRRAGDPGEATSLSCRHLRLSGWRNLPPRGGQNARRLHRPRDRPPTRRRHPSRPARV